LNLGSLMMFENKFAPTAELATVPVNWLVVPYLTVTAPDEYNENANLPTSALNGFNATKLTVAGKWFLSSVSTVLDASAKVNNPF